VNNIFKYLSILIVLSNCSLDTKSGIWTKEKDTVVEKDNNNEVFVEIFNEDKALDKEFNSKLKIKLSTKLIDNNLGKNLTNNHGRINYDGKLKKISKFKFSKVNNFKYHEPDLIFEGDNLFFFDKKGSIIKFDANSKIIWKKNFYNKQEKKQNLNLNFAKNSSTLIIADNISKYYALDINNGNLLWTKYNSSPLNSQIKTYKDKFFMIDFNNVLKGFSIKDGSELWSLKSNNTFIKSDKKLSLVIVNDVLYFNNSGGDITAVDVNNGHMLWQTPTQNTSIYENTFLLKTSNIVANKEMLIFSNNKNEFYSLDLINGNVRWKQKINSNLQSSIINDLIFSVTNEGYLILIENKTGNIIRATDIFGELNIGSSKNSKIGFLNDKKINPLYMFDKKNIKKETKRTKFEPTGFIVGKNNIYLTTSHGRLFVIDIESGKRKSIVKVDNKKISSPFVFNNNLFLIKEDSIVKLD